MRRGKTSEAATNIIPVLRIFLRKIKRYRYPEESSESREDEPDEQSESESE